MISSTLYRLIESDTKSLNSLVETAKITDQDSCGGHSRMSSITSEVSVRSSDESNPIDSEEADLWTLWGKLLNEWESMTKKSSLIIKVRESKRKATTSILIKIIDW